MAQISKKIDDKTLVVNYEIDRMSSIYEGGSGVRFMFVKKPNKDGGIENMTRIGYCRDQLIGACRRLYSCPEFKKSDLMVVVSSDHIQKATISKIAIENALKILNIYGNSFAKETTAERVIIDPSLLPNSDSYPSSNREGSLFVADNTWKRIPHLLSLFFLLIRHAVTYAHLGAIDISNLDSLEKYWKDLSANNNDYIQFIKPHYKMFSLIFNNLDSIFSRKHPYYCCNNFSEEMAGILSLCRHTTQHVFVNKRMFELCGENNLLTGNYRILYERGFRFGKTINNLKKDYRTLYDSIIYMKNGYGISNRERSVLNKIIETDSFKATAFNHRAQARIRVVGIYDRMFTII